MYHHFTDKRDLFRAVYEELEAEVAQQVAEAVAREPLSEHHLETGVEAFLDACLDPAYRRIELVEAPSVLGYGEWQGVGAKYSLDFLRAALEAAMDIGRIERQPVDPLAHVLLGALAEAALMLARAEDVEAARGEVGSQTILRLLAGLAPPG